MDSNAINLSPGPWLTITAMRYSSFQASGAPSVTLASMFPSNCSITLDDMEPLEVGKFMTNRKPQITNTIYYGSKTVRRSADLDEIGSASEYMRVKID